MQGLLEAVDIEHFVLKMLADAPRIQRAAGLEADDLAYRAPSHVLPKDIDRALRSLQKKGAVVLDRATGQWRLAEAVVQVTEATDAEKLEIAKKAFREIIRGCEYRLRKGPDSGDQQSLNIAKDALKALV
jgi:hypothetical protein